MPNLFVIHYQITEQGKAMTYPNSVLSSEINKSLATNCKALLVCLCNSHDTCEIRGFESYCLVGHSLLFSIQNTESTLRKGE